MPTWDDGAEDPVVRIWLCAVGVGKSPDLERVVPSETRIKGQT